MTEDDATWADVIFVMEKRHSAMLRARFATRIDRSRVHVLDIPGDECSKRRGG